MSLNLVDDEKLHEICSVICAFDQQLERHSSSSQTFHRSWRFERLDEVLPKKDIVE